MTTASPKMVDQTPVVVVEVAAVSPKKAAQTN